MKKAAIIGRHPWRTGKLWIELVYEGLFELGSLRAGEAHDQEHEPVPGHVVGLVGTVLVVRVRDFLKVQEIKIW